MRNVGGGAAFAKPPSSTLPAAVVPAAVTVPTACAPSRRPRTLPLPVHSRSCSAGGTRLVASLAHPAHPISQAATRWLHALLHAWRLCTSTTCQRAAWGASWRGCRCSTGEAPPGAMAGAQGRCQSCAPEVRMCCAAHLLLLCADTFQLHPCVDCRRQSAVLVCRRWHQAATAHSCAAASAWRSVGSASWPACARCASGCSSTAASTSQRLP